MSHNLDFCLSMQNDIFEWARDHRVHHKCSETNADPHNAKRGFFFSHVGWLLCRKHPMVIEKGRKIDMSDLKADKVVMFQRRWANTNQSLSLNLPLFFCSICNQRLSLEAIYWDFGEFTRAPVLHNSCTEIMSANGTSLICKNFVFHLIFRLSAINMSEKWMFFM